MPTEPKSEENYHINLRLFVCLLDIQFMSRFLCAFYMFGSVRFRFGKQNFDWLVLFGLGRTVKHCFGRSLLCTYALTCYTIIVNDLMGKCQKSNCISYFFRKNLICNLRLQVTRITQHTRHISIHQISSKLVVNILTGSYSTFLHLYSKAKLF